MTIEGILRGLPDSISWLVLFEIEGFRAVADEQTMKDMYFLNQQVDLSKFNYVVLTSQGRYLTSSESETFVHGETLEDYSFTGSENLYNAYVELLPDFPINDAQSFAVAEDPEFGKVLLYIELKDGFANSEALFKAAPTQELYELLQAVGVRYLGGKDHGNWFKAQFQNRLSVHIMSGTINDYSRTDNCNVFFFRHGRIDQFLKDGLFTAAKKRLQIMSNLVNRDLQDLAQRSLNEKLSMSWLPPVGDEKFPFGDQVPKGFVLRALNNLGESEIRTALEKDLREHSLRGLWCFETDDLETSTDSVLVLQSLEDRKAARQLNQFAADSGGLYPQLWSAEPKPGEMPYDPRKRHWCQPDIATSALALAIQINQDVDPTPNLERFVLENFDNRSGLYFANPYMIDWIYAQALTKISATEKQRDQLRNELLGSLNTDYSFGQFDKVLSSAFGILALTELGYRGNAIVALQLYIINNYHAQKRGTNVPFYSSLINEDGRTEGRTVTLSGTVIDLSLHEDSFDMIYVSMVSLALSISIESEELTENTYELIGATLHPRYQCNSVREYVERFALIPFVRAELPTS